MTAPAGYNPMRWSCEERGCYNVKHRPKIEVFADLWPGRISMGDVDGIVEIKGNVLMMEWKSVAGELPRGQSIMYQRITNGKRWTVICVAGIAETMTVYAYKMFWNGRESPKERWIQADLNMLRERLLRWRAYAESNPRISG